MYLAYMPYLFALHKYAIEALLPCVDSNPMARPALFDVDLFPQLPDEICFTIFTKNV